MTCYLEIIKPAVLGCGKGYSVVDFRVILKTSQSLRPPYYTVAVKGNAIRDSLSALLQLQQASSSARTVIIDNNIIIIMII